MKRIVPWGRVVSNIETLSQMLFSTSKYVVLICGQSIQVNGWNEWRKQKLWWIAENWAREPNKLNHYNQMNLILLWALNFTSFAGFDVLLDHRQGRIEACVCSWSLISILHSNSHQYFNVSFKFKSPFYIHCHKKMLVMRYTLNDGQ